MEVIKISFVLVSAAWILYEYYMKIYKEKVDHLRLNVQIQNINSFLNIKTSVENNTLNTKDIFYAFVIVSPFNSDFLKAINTKFDLNLDCTNKLYELKNKLSSNIYRIGEDAVIMPLSFYFNENIGVGNELLTHSIPIGVKKEYRLNKTTELNHYDVRFFVYRNPKDVNNYHRLTHCSFTTNKRISELFLYNDKDDVPPNKKI